MTSWLYAVPVAALILIIAVAAAMQHAFAKSAEACGQRLREQYRLNAKQFDGGHDGAPPAWAAAQTYLHTYIANNVFQVKMIFWASMFVMLVGFFITCFGIVEQFRDLPKGGEGFARSFPIVAGVLTQFIAATFLFVLRSTSQSSAMFVNTLDRMNSVGMAMCILRGMPEDVTVELLRANAYADVARNLISAVHSGLATSPVPNETVQEDRLASLRGGSDLAVAGHSTSSSGR